jgi:hypothetical protein
MAERQFKPRFEVPFAAKNNPLAINHPGFLSWENSRNGFHVAVVHYTADPEKRSEEWYQGAVKNLREDQIKREYEIDFESQAGQKAFWYLETYAKKYRIPNVDLKRVPKHWRLVAGLDYGSTNPTSLHIYAIDERRRIKSIWEFYKSSSKDRSIVDEIAMALQGTHPDPKYQHGLWRRIEKVICDPSIFNDNQQDTMKEQVTSIGAMLEERGIYNLESANNERQGGLERVKEMLNYLPENPNFEPYLQFCERCENQWKEFTNVVYDEIPPHQLINKNEKEDIKKKNDHSYDECRYVLMAVTSPAKTEADLPPGSGTLGEFDDSLDAAEDEDLPDYF